VDAEFCFFWQSGRFALAIANKKRYNVGCCGSGRLFTWIFEKLAAFSTQHFQPEQDPVCLLTKE